MFTVQVAQARQFSGQDRRETEPTVHYTAELNSYKFLIEVVAK